MKVITGARVPVKSWADDVEEGALKQAMNAANLPFAISHVALMPDAHRGYGVPIGSVLFADKAVVPYAIGVDIGCGVALIETDLTRADITDDEIGRFLAQVARDVPVGNGPQAQHKAEQDLFWPNLDLSDLVVSVMGPARSQLGTLGGGNHFLELQQDAEGRVWFMLHSGSRSVGKKLCDHHHKIALGLNQRWHSDLPDKELAYLPWGTDEAAAYWADMTVALAWAEENRRRMVAKVVYAFDRTWQAKAWQVNDTHHNYAAWENHMGRNGIVHRKGAVKADVTDTVLIPGSMGTASYVALGLGNPLSFKTCQHGAGRARGRGETRRMTTLAAMDEQLAAAGVQLVTPQRGEVIDESPVAYKDVHAVMRASADLVRPLRVHTPLGVVKG